MKLLAQTELSRPHAYLYCQTSQASLFVSKHTAFCSECGNEFTFSKVNPFTQKIYCSKCGRGYDYKKDEVIISKAYNVELPYITMLKLYELKNKIDGLWDIFAAGGLVNPLEVIEQITYLMFIHDLDDSDNMRARESAMLGLPFQSIFSGEVKIGERTIDGSQLKWSVFHDFPADRMYMIMQEWVFPFIKNLHVHEHCRVCVVQVPLVVVEGGQHPLVHLLTPCKVAGCGVGEHLRHGLLVLVGDGTVLVEVVIRLKPRVARLCRHGPAVGAGGVVHHKIQTQADACFPQLPGQVFKVFVGAKGRVYGIEILHRIAAIVVGMGHLQKGHQVQIGQLLLLEVGQLLCQFFQISGKEVGVHGHAEHIAAFIPFRVGGAGFVQCFQFRTADLPCLLHFGFQRVQGFTVVVQLHEQPFQFVLVLGKPGLKFLFCCHRSALPQKAQSLCNLIVADAAQPRGVHRALQAVLDFF